MPIAARHARPGSLGCPETGVAGKRYARLRNVPCAQRAQAGILGANTSSRGLGGSGSITLIFGNLMQPLMMPPVTPSSSSVCSSALGQDVEIVVRIIEPPIRTTKTIEFSSL